MLPCIITIYTKPLIQGYSNYTIITSYIIHSNTYRIQKYKKDFNDYLLLHFTFSPNNPEGKNFR